MRLGLVLAVETSLGFVGLPCQALVSTWECVVLLGQVQDPGPQMLKQKWTVGDHGSVILGLLIISPPFLLLWKMMRQQFP